MPPAATRAQAELHHQKAKLANSYSELLEYPSTHATDSEFSSKDLRTVGNYAVGRLIGKGSFGKVYLASNKLINGSKVVLKSAKKDDANLAREIHHHRQFLHPHIARLYEVIVTESLVWLVLEWCPGDELYNHLLEHGRMQENQVQKIFTQLVGAVSYVHSKSCVHRDLKLENILLDKHGNVKLVDFGFTREYQGSTSYLQTWCGTVCYSAPEMLKGEKYAGEKVDVWSLGIILYALLCGELPFDEDDENETKQRILKEDPKYPEYVPEGAKDLLSKLLSRRPLLRPPLADVLRHPWLQEYAPQQQEILKVLQPPPFSTEVEKATLQRMRSAGVNIDHVIENVLGQRCDPLAGWWGLLLEKEERKERRRLRKRREKEAEARSIRRLSASSSRLLNAPSLREITEEEQARLSIVSPKTRGRGVSRSSAAPPDLPRVTEGKTPEPDERPPPPVEKDQRRRSLSITSSSCGPALPPKDVPRRPRAASRGSSQLLQVIHTRNDLLAPPPFHQKLRKRPFKDQLAHLKSWFKTSSGRSQKKDSQENLEVQLATARKASASIPSSQRRGSANDLLMDQRKSPRPDMPTRTTYPVRPRISTASSYGSTGSRTHGGNRPSLSPAPLTPRSSIYRRSSGLRGRKSTSSSVSSVRSIHTHHHSLSRASTTSSNSVASPSLSTHSRAISRSPHTSGSVVVLPPSTPTSSVTGTFPSGIRVARRPPPGNLGTLPTLSTQALNSPMSYTFGPASPGMHPVFAKKKRSVFKGPSLGNTPGARGRGTGNNSSDNSRGTSAQGRRSNEITIAEEDEEEEEQQQQEPKDFFGSKVTLHDQGMRLVEEDEEEDLEVEEVESFSPIEEGDTTAFIIEEEEGEDPDGDVTVIPNLGEDEVETVSSPEMSRDAKTIAEDVLSRRVVEEGDAEEGDTSLGLGISGAGNK
ncbi:kinase-like protein [Aureobasidium sp. EXF-10727]|nr:kinase-like protein [Aureobasidium sp. EXF-10727]